MSNTTECGCIRHGRNECLKEILCKGCGDCMAWRGYEEGTKYCGWKYKCGRYNFKDDDIDLEEKMGVNTTLQQRQQHRLWVFNKYKEGLQEMRDIKKGTRYRKWLYYRLEYLANKEFEDEDEEYSFINKAGRGMWEKCETTFKTKIEKGFIMKIALGYGAFNY